jgi:hypothetical protein
MKEETWRKNQKQEIQTGRQISLTSTTHEGYKEDSTRSTDFKPWK